MPLITTDDIIETYAKLRQRGLGFILKKLNFSGKERTLGAFDESAISSANWWIIPRVQERWNKLQTGDENINYKQYLIKEHFADKEKLRMVSFGSGNCRHELELAEYEQFQEVICVDIAKNRLDEAAILAGEKGLKNIKFLCEDINKFDFQKESFDLVHFNQSLHHFENVEELLSLKIKPSLKSDGILLVNEFVGTNRMQYPRGQVKAIREAIMLIDKEFRMRYKTKMVKSGFSGSGWLRMIIADPSECVDSASIIPALHEHFRVIEERPYGGNILMGVLKDISHHFLELDQRKSEILDQLFAYEDDYIKDKQSDFVFGLYGRKKTHSPKKVVF
jgi:ubiquinone/menaquinone biosynthesis C-methylase UbiE